MTDRIELSIVSPPSSELRPARLMRPFTFEELLQVTLPAQLSGRAGTNRVTGRAAQIQAEEDLQAITKWLREFDISPQTFRAYRGQVERFCNWAFLIRGKAISSMTIDDINAYESFMREPTPPEFWIASKTNKGKPKCARRGDVAWRPFQKPVDHKGIGQASIILAAMFSYLQDVGYLIGNPYAARRLKKRKAARPMALANESPDDGEQTTTSDHDEPDPHIPLSLLLSVLDTLEEAINDLPADAKKSRSRLERMLFVTRFLSNTGLRREELAAAVMNDIRFREARGTRVWYMKVVGKGAKKRDVPLNEKARMALERYHGFYGVPQNYAKNKAPILLPLSGKAAIGGNLGSNVVYTTVDDAFELALERLTTLTDDDKAFLDRASPHKFRHAFATIMSEDRNVSVRGLSKILGHSSDSTTSGYLHPDLHKMFAAIDKVGV